MAMSSSNAVPIRSSNESLLTEEMLTRFDSRAATYDRENRFFEQDFEELRATKYLLLPVPKEFGGAGFTLEEMCEEQRRLAYYAPATALGVNMHIYWVGVAADLWRRGDRSLEWILREAAAGEIFAAGHAEAGNDVPILLSTSKAERVAGGYRFTGRKQFGSLTPVWTRLGLHAMDTSDPRQPKIVHAFMPGTVRDTSSRKHGMYWVCGRRGATTPFWRMRSFPTGISRGWFLREVRALMDLCYRFSRGG